MASETITSICKRTVVSTKAVPRGKHYPLSVLDRLMEKNHIRLVLYYPSMGEHVKAGELIRRLRASLAEMLTHFPIATGRLVRSDDDGKWMIKCNDAGVRMVEARAKGSVQEWLKGVDREKELLLVRWEEMFHDPYFWSPFCVQLTEFEDGGFAVGLSCIHLMADATCATMFINTWATTTFYGNMLASYFHPLPPRRPGNKNPNHVPYTSLINHYKSTIENTISIPLQDSKHTTISLLFSDQMVRACIELAQNSTKAHNKSPSLFEALAGLFWVCVSRVKRKGGGLVNMSVCLDMRKLLGVDKRFFGNCMVYNNVQTRGLCENNLSQAAAAISDVVAKMDNEGIMDLIEWLQHDHNGSIPVMNGCDLVCTSLEVVDPYLALFGDGVGPIRVSCYVEPVLGLGQVLILPGPPGEGQLSRVVMVTLPVDEAVKLCEDDLLLSFSPTILMGVNKN
ncbi:hypothetical protein UlMin_043231 [Ulmus minor]